MGARRRAGRLRSSIAARARRSSSSHRTCRGELTSHASSAARSSEGRVTRRVNRVDWNTDSAATERLVQLRASIAPPRRHLHRLRDLVHLAPLVDHRRAVDGHIGREPAQDAEPQRGRDDGLLEGRAIAEPGGVAVLELAHLPARPGRGDRRIVADAGNDRLAPRRAGRGLAAHLHRPTRPAAVAAHEQERRAREQTRRPIGHQRIGQHLEPARRRLETHVGHDRRADPAVDRRPSPRRADPPTRPARTSHPPAPARPAGAGTLR